MKEPKPFDVRYLIKKIYCINKLFLHLLQNHGTASSEKLKTSQTLQKTSKIKLDMKYLQYHRSHDTLQEPHNTIYE